MLQCAPPWSAQIYDIICTIEFWTTKCNHVNDSTGITVCDHTISWLIVVDNTYRPLLQYTIWPSKSIQISFWYVFDQKHRKIYEIYMISCSSCSFCLCFMDRQSGSTCLIPLLIDMSRQLSNCLFKQNWVHNILKAYKINGQWQK